MTISTDGLAIRLIGGFELRKGAETLSLGKRKACAILAYLMLSGRSRETRGRLAALLWSEQDEEHARGSLRQCIKDLRRLASETRLNFLTVDKLVLGIDPTSIRSDIDELERALDDRNYDRALLLLGKARDGLCAGLDDCDPVFDNWLRMQSTMMTDRLVTRLAAWLAAETDPRQRKSIAACILQLDPFFDDAVVETIRRVCQESGYARARAFFERYAAELKADMDLRPPGEILRLVEALKPGKGDEKQATGPGLGRSDHDSRIPGKPMIAIIIARREAENEHLQFALATELLASISRFRHWTALSTELQTSRISFDDVRVAAGENVDIGVLIRLIDADVPAVFEITCYDFLQGGEAFRLTVPSDPSSWRSAFNEVCARFSARLQIALSSARLHRISPTSQNHFSAYDCWLDGQRLSIMWRKDTEEAAIARYEEAIRLDPDLSCAYSSLAAVLNSRWIVVPGAPSIEQDLTRAFELAKRSVLLDPFDHRNQVNLAWSHLLGRRWDLADFHFSLAHEQNAGNPATLIAYALASSFMGHHERALELSKRCFELNPVPDAHYHGYQATIAFLADDLEGCVDAAAKCDQLFADIHGWSAAALALLKRNREAGDEFRRFLRNLSAAWQGQGRPDRALAVDWFSTAFPIRHPADQVKLARGIELAAQSG
ncbi:DNA-binding SARP family transcriptional activator [Mesorhizobium sp. URHB0026]